MDGPHAKAEARARVRTRLASVTPAARAERAARLPDRLAALDAWSQTDGAVMAYLAFGNELSVDGAIRRAWSGGRTVAVPRTDWSARRLEPVAYAEGASVVPGRHCVPEIMDGAPVPVENLALVLVPGVAFTTDGARLGRGGGFYDRFLRTLLDREAVARPPFVGVCFEEQLEDELPAEAHDIPMDAVIAV